MKKLIIVCEEKLRLYGDFLSQLVSIDDDKIDEIIGVKDGNVAVQVWAEKEYVANAAQISSEQYILFIGNSKLQKDKRVHMVLQFSQYGMEYGWLGKQGALYIEKAVDIKDYNSFIEFARHNQSDVKRLVEEKPDFISLPTATKESVGVIKKVVNQLITLPVALVNVPVRGFNAIRKLANNNKIIEQEYSCLVLAFYLKGLSQFLGLNEE